MSAEKILSEDWEDYDNRKLKKGDSQFFSCDESWEVDYLVDKIDNAYPRVGREAIREAIKQCCQTVHGNKPRAKFVACVMARLGLDDNPDDGNPPKNPGQGPQNPPIPPNNRNVG